MTVNSSSHRLIAIDAIRGLAVLGIFLLNIFNMGVSYYEYVPHQQPHWSDTLWDLLYYFVLRDRFMTLFAMLFGVGIYLQWQRFSAPSSSIKQRMLWLLLFGWLHCLFIWPGDILFNYAVCGLILLRYITSSTEETLSLAWRFFAMGILLTVASVLLMDSDDASVIFRESEAYQQDLQAWTGSYFGQVERQGLMWMLDLVVFPLTYLWQLLGLMLLGIYGLRSHWFTHGLPHWRRWLLPSAMLLSAISFALAQGQNEQLTALAEALTNVAAVPMSLWFIDTLVQNRHLPKRLYFALQAVGRIPLTLYIGQSLFGVLLLRHIAPSFNSSMDWYGYLAIALVWGGLQLIIAPLWLSYFRQGPLEWLWRRLAFGSHYQQTR